MIRAARAEDAAAVGRVHAAAWTETYPGLVPDALLARMSDPAHRIAQWTSRLARPDHGVLVAEWDGAVVGFGAAGPTRDAALGTAGEVLTLYVLRAAQRRGLGVALLRGLGGVLRDRGLESVGLWVLDTNHPARAFYAACGGSETVRREDDWLLEVAYVWPAGLGRCGAT